MWPGSNHDLGATWTEESTNFAVWAPEATAAYVCLVADDGTETRHRLTERSLGIWHGAVPDVEPGQRYGYRMAGPWAPDQGLRFNAQKLLLDPYARAVSGELVQDPAIFGYTVGAPENRDFHDSASQGAAERGRRQRLRLGLGHPDQAALARHRHLRAARQGHDPAARPGARGAARHVRRAGAPGRHRLPARPRGSPRSSCCRSTSSSPSRRSPRAGWSTTGATTRSASSPRTRRTPPAGTAASR